MAKKTTARKPREPRKKPEGLGDTVEKVLKATGIAAIVKFIAGEDCGCDERKKKLNEMFPYKKVECLTETEYQYLDELFKGDLRALRPTQQQILVPMYSRIFNVRQEPSNCASCWIDILNDLRKVYNEYGKTGSE